MSELDNTTEMVVSINSGSSLVVKSHVLSVMGVLENDATIGLDSVGNVTSVTAYVLLTNLHVITETLLNTPGVNGISTPSLNVQHSLLRFNMRDVLAWVLANDISIQFAGGSDGINGPFGFNHYAGPKAGVTVDLVVCNGDGIVNSLNSDSSVIVTASGGTAPKVNGLSGPQTVAFNAGEASVVVSDSAVGTVTLTLSSPTHPSNVLVVDQALVALA